MKLIKKELPEKSFKINRCFTINLSLYNKNYKVFHSTSKELYKEECIRSLTSLYNCKCCSRHQENKPTQEYIVKRKRIRLSIS